MKQFLKFLSDKKSTIGATLGLVIGFLVTQEIITLDSGTILFAINTVWTGYAATVEVRQNRKIKD